MQIMAIGILSVGVIFLVGLSVILSYIIYRVLNLQYRFWSMVDDGDEHTIKLVLSNELCKHGERIGISRVYIDGHDTTSFILGTKYEVPAESYVFVRGSENVN